MWYILTMEYYVVIKKNELLIHTRAQINLENIMLSVRNQTQKTMYCVFPLTRIVQNRLFQKQKVGQLLLGTEEGREGRVMIYGQRIFFFLREVEIMKKFWNQIDLELDQLLKSLMCTNLQIYQQSLNRILQKGECYSV